MYRCCILLVLDLFLIISMGKVQPSKTKPTPEQPRRLTVSVKTPLQKPPGFQDVTVF